MPDAKTVISIGIGLIILTLFVLISDNLISDTTNDFAATDNFGEDVDNSTSVTLTYIPAVSGSEVLTINTATAVKDTNYTIDYTTGTVTFIDIADSSAVTAAYRYYKGTYISGSGLTRTVASYIGVLFAVGVLVFLGAGWIARKR